MAYDVPNFRIQRQTGPMNCWFYAAASMKRWRRQPFQSEADWRVAGAGLARGPDTQIVLQWLDNGLSTGHMEFFARRFGFDRLASQPANWNEASLTTTLSSLGPLFMGGRVQRQLGFVTTANWHACVICGVTATSVKVGDPAGGDILSIPFAIFNGWKQQETGMWNPLHLPTT